MRSLLLAVCLVLALHCGEADLTCDTVVALLYPCLSYLDHGGSNPPAPCCDGIRTIESLGQTPVDRQSICRCIKLAVAGITWSWTHLKNAVILPSACGVSFSYRISPNAAICESVI